MNLQLVSMNNPVNGIAVVALKLQVSPPPSFSAPQLSHFASCHPNSLKLDSWTQPVTPQPLSGVPRRAHVPAGRGAQYAGTARERDDAEAGIGASNRLQVPGHRRGRGVITSAMLRRASMSICCIFSGMIALGPLGKMLVDLI